MSKRQRPWPVLRVIVEVTVPPQVRATEKDLAWLVKESLPRTLALRRPIHDNPYHAVPRVKTLSRWLAWFRSKGYRK